MSNQTYFEEVQLGDTFGPVAHEPTHVQLFRYSAVTWNPHRIHYDQAYAATEGYPDVLVQSHLHGAFVTELISTIAGELGQVKTIDVSVRRFAVPGDRLICQAKVTAKEGFDEEFGQIWLDVDESRELDGAICVPATARVLLPLRRSAAS
jgi:acyl dehydratase